MACRAIRSKGKGCECKEFQPRTKDAKCGGCKHRLADHEGATLSAPTTSSAQTTSLSAPTTSSSTSSSLVDRIIAKYSPRVSDSGSDAAAASTSAIESAKRESNSTFRTKKPAVKKAFKSGLENELFKVGTVVVIPGGFDEEGKLNDDICPKAFRLEELRKAGLSVSKDNLEISIQWMQSEIDDWLRTLFPLVFQWLDARWGKPESGRFHWALLQKSYSRLIVLDRPAMTGKDLFLVRGAAGKSFMLHTIYIGLLHSVSSNVYNDWDTAIADPQAIDVDLDNVSDEEEEITTRRKPRSGRLLKKEKGKGRARPRTPQASGNEWDGCTYDSDLDKSIRNDSDIEIVSEGTVANPVSIQDSDGETPRPSMDTAEPSPLPLRPCPRPRPLKRRRLPSVDSEDEARSVSSKRSRLSASPNIAGASSASSSYVTFPLTTTAPESLLDNAPQVEASPVAGPSFISNSLNAGPSSVSNSLNATWSPISAGPAPAPAPNTSHQISPRRGFSSAPRPRFDPWA